MISTSKMNVIYKGKIQTNGATAVASAARIPHTTVDPKVMSYYMHCVPQW